MNFYEMFPASSRQQSSKNQSSFYHESKDMDKSVLWLT